MKNLVVLDCEVFPNYFLVALKNLDTQKMMTFEVKGKDSYLTAEQKKKLVMILSKRTTFGFNSRNYDMPIIHHALRGATCQGLCKLSNHIIENNVPYWRTYKELAIQPSKAFKHFDIQEPTPGVMIGLKQYGARMHTQKLQDLPIEPNTMLTAIQAEAIKSYCENDLNVTIELYEKVKDRIDLRVKMSEQYNLDLLSLSDAQIAEAVVRSEMRKRSISADPTPTVVPEGTIVKYVPPDFIKYKSDNLNAMLDFIAKEEFPVNGLGRLEMSPELRNMKVKIGDGEYNIGIGGMHSREKSQVVYPAKDELLIDNDVSSYYPAIISKLSLYPTNLTPMFLEWYRQVTQTRLKAKKAGDKVVADTLKILLNGAFGKSAQKFSSMYSPSNFLATTITGQLSVLMLIERTELAGMRVVSGNTDGYVTLCKKSQYPLLQKICEDFQTETTFELEETRYTALYSRDVNSYLALKENGYKGKGIFTLNDLQKNPQNEICILAVIDHLQKGVPVADTIRGCTDIRKFLRMQSVTGGAVYKGEYLGKVVRWIYSTESDDPITYKGNGNKVGKSDNCRPIMELCDVPDDIDYDRYIEEARDILTAIGTMEL